MPKNVFCLVKVSDSKNITGKVIGVGVHWHELIKQMDVFTRRYGGDFLHKTYAKKINTWTDPDSTASAMVALDKLTNKGTLSASVRKHLHRELTSI